MIEAKLRVRLPRSCAMAQVSRKAEVRLLDAAPYQREGVKSLLEIECGRCSGEVVGEIKSGVVEGMSKISSSKIRASVAVPKCVPARSIIEAGCFIKSARHTEDGVEWIITARRSSLAKLARLLESQNYSFELLRVGEIQDAPALLTERERDVLEYAFATGYFDIPKRAGVREIAEHFGISISTASDILRRGVRKIVKKYLEEE